MSQADPSDRKPYRELVSTPEFSALDSNSTPPECEQESNFKSLACQIALRDAARVIIITWKDAFSKKSVSTRIDRWQFKTLVGLVEWYLTNSVAISSESGVSMPGLENQILIAPESAFNDASTSKCTLLPVLKLICKLLEISKAVKAEIPDYLTTNSDLVVDCERSTVTALFIVWLDILHQGNLNGVENGTWLKLQEINSRSTSDKWIRLTASEFTVNAAKESSTTTVAQYCRSLKVSTPNDKESTVGSISVEYKRVERT